MKTLKNEFLGWHVRLNSGVLALLFALMTHMGIVSSVHAEEMDGQDEGAQEIVASVRPPQTVIQGVEHDGRGVQLPIRLCAQPGQELRFGAMVVNPDGSGGVPPAEAVLWTIIQENGHAIEWSPAWSNGSGPFRRDPRFARAIRLHMPTRGGFQLRFRAEAQRTRPTQIEIVDPQGYGNPVCHWGPAGMYVRQ
jgi:hypothetical protein